MRKLFLAPVLGAAAAAGLLAFSAAQTDKAETFRQLELFGDVLARVQTEYVSETEDADLIENAINGMLTSLDPHSSYMSPDAFRDMQVSTRGEYGGLGLEVTMDPALGVVEVVAPFDDTPASRAGLQSGDYITGIDGESIIGLSIDEAVDKMRGPAGAAINLTIVRAEQEPFDVDLVREIINVATVDAKVIDGIGYVRLKTFANEHAHEHVAEALADLEAELGRPLPGIVLDLRNNPGGLLDEAIAVSDIFLDGGEVVSTRGRDPRDTQRYNAQRGEQTGGAPVVVLVNGGSASAAEIVAGALQDRQRATVVGETSFGKGSVQTVIPLRGGRDGALRLTTQRYYTPSGRSIQATGIVPDIEIASERTDPEQSRLRQREADLPGALRAELEAARAAAEAEDGEAAEEHPIEEPGEDWPTDWTMGDPATDYQLKRAIEVLQTMDMAAVRPRSGG